MSTAKLTWLCNCPVAPILLSKMIFAWSSGLTRSSGAFMSLISWRLNSSRHWSINCMLSVLADRVFSTRSRIYSALIFYLLIAIVIALAAQKSDRFRYEFSFWVCAQTNSRVPTISFRSFFAAFLASGGSYFPTTHWDSGHYGLGPFYTQHCPTQTSNLLTLTLMVRSLIRPATKKPQ